MSITRADLLKAMVAVQCPVEGCVFREKEEEAASRMLDVALNEIVGAISVETEKMRLTSGCYVEYCTLSALERQMHSLLKDSGKLGTE